MKILALDPATRTGWAVWSGGHIVASGTWDLSVRRDESSGMRLIRFRAKLTEVVESERVDVVAFEVVSYGGPHMMGASVQAELQGVLKLWCEDRHLEYLPVNLSTVKRRATGKGNAGKPLVIAAARAEWPGWNGDDNEADARWIAVVGAEQLGARSAA